MGDGLAHCHIPALTMVPTGTQMFDEGIHKKKSTSKYRPPHTALLQQDLQNLADPVPES